MDVFEANTSESMLEVKSRRTTFVSSKSQTTIPINSIDISHTR